MRKLFSIAAAALAIAFSPTLVLAQAAGDVTDLTGAITTESATFLTQLWTVSPAIFSVLAGVMLMFLLMKAFRRGAR